MPSKRPQLIIALCLAAACVGDIRPRGGGTGSGASGAGGGTGEAPIQVVPGPAQIRVLSAPEYRNTVKDLLGLEPSANLTQSDWSSGFDNGSGIHVDENLFSVLLNEGESLAARYVATRLAADFPCFDPANVADGCVRTVIAQLGRRAWRRPLTSAQQDELLSFFGATATAVSSRVTATEVLIARLITSPAFLYRTEAGREVAATRYALDDFEKASLLSYSLTGSMPDEPLLADAEAGLLDEPRLRAHVQRLWAEPRTRVRVATFFRQWLKLTALDELERRPEGFTKLPAPELGASLKRELDAYLGAVVFDGKGTLPALFSESFTLVDRNTAPLYGLSSTSDVPVRVELEPTQRRGVLTLASTMAAIASASDPERDRPVLRGLMVKRQLLCETVGPPSAVNTVAAANTAMMIPNFAELTTREQYEAMMQQGDECRACHRQFMPMGFTLGGYDALGRFRTTQHGRPIVTAVSDVPFAGQTRAFSGPLELTDALAASPDAAACMAKNLVSYTVGEAHTDHVDTLSAALTRKLGAGPLSIPKLVEEVLISAALRERHGVPDTTTASGTGGGAGGGGGGGGGTGGGAPAAVTTVLLPSGATLRGDESRVSQDGVYRLVYQLDGNLVLYRVAGGAPWASGTAGTTVGTTSMQGDGNLVVYDRDGAPKFNTGTQNNPGATLQIDAAGRLYIVAGDGSILKEMNP